MILFGCRQHGDYFASAWLSQSSPDPQSGETDWTAIFHFSSDKHEFFAGGKARRGFAYYPTRAVAERAAACFLESASIDRAQRIKPLPHEIPPPPEF